MLPEERELAHLLEGACERQGVPGAVAAVSAAGQSRVAATGIVRLPDGAPVTADTLFLIGSITKVWTATIVMQLVGEGAVELDAPVQRYLDPPLKLADQEVANTVTVRQLLTHTGGFRGDKEELPHRGDDAVQRTVAGYADLSQVHRPGRLFSYSNTGYNVLGRLVECVTGGTWDDALRLRLIEPLGLRQASTMPERTMVHPVAVGHEPDASGGLTGPVQTWLTAPGDGPCGGTLATSAADLLTFARMHLANGQGLDGRRVLPGAAARLMRTVQVRQPDPLVGVGWGLGWTIERLADPLVVGHSGSVAGQQARLLVVPEHDFAACMLTNGDPSTDARQEVLDSLLRQVTGVGLPTAPVPSGEPIDPAIAERCSGRYDDGALALVVSALDGQLLVREDDQGGETFFSTSDTPLQPAGADTFLVAVPRLGLDAPVIFVNENGNGGPPTHVLVIGQALPRR